MWKRITTCEQLRNIGAGTLLIKYSGTAENTLDMNDKERISVRYVVKNLPAFEEFDISLIPYQIEHFLFIISDLKNISFAAMHKKYNDIISEGNYWIYKGEDLSLS
jgi:hypothetical protein